MRTDAFTEEREREAESEGRAVTEANEGNEEELKLVRCQPNHTAS